MDSAQDFARIGCAHLLEAFGKVPKIDLWEDFGATCWLGDVCGVKNGPEKNVLWRNDFVVGF